MKASRLLWMTLLVIVAVSCAKEDDSWQDLMPQGDGPGGMVPGNGTGVNASIGELTSFTIAVDSTSLAETETIDTHDEDYIENNSFSQVVNVRYDGNTATVTGDTDGVTITTDGAHVTATATGKVNYVLSGSTSNGSLKLYGEKKLAITLNGVSITNPTGAAINNQCKKRAYIVLVEGTVNTLRDGSTYTMTDGEDMKATLFSEGKLLFSGKGRLRVYANCKAGITSDEYVLFRPGNNVYVRSTLGNGVKANDAILVRGGVINIEASAPGVKGLSSDALVQVDGGRTTVITTGDSEWDSDEKDLSSAAGIKADSACNINGGIINLMSTGKGGKGINCDDVLTINGGSLRVITTGARHTYGSTRTSPKGIKSDKLLAINGGNVMLRTTGGEGAEAIESKTQVLIAGGTVEAYAYDDVINGKKDVTIGGGKVFCYSSNNDGIDSNGTLNLQGGVVVSFGTTSPEDAFYTDNGTFTITGGTAIGIGGGTSSPSSSTSTQPVVMVGGSSLAAGTYVAVAGNSGNVLALLVPRAYTQYTLLVTSPGLTKGGTCSITTGATVTGGTEFDGLITGAAVTGGTTLFSGTLSSIVTSSGVTGGMGGGGQMGW